MSFIHEHACAFKFYTVPLSPDYIKHRVGISVHNEQSEMQPVHSILTVSNTTGLVQM